MGAGFEHEIIHNPAWNGQYPPDMKMRDFLSSCISGIPPIPWEDEGQDRDYNQWAGEFPPFTVINTLGKSAAATVERVLCHNCSRVIARKSINFEHERRQVLAKREITCLKSLRHPHIVAFVGAYFDGPAIGILLYPAAEWNLEQFMVDVPNLHNEAKRYHLRRYFVCLAQAVSYLHDSKIRHKDIKPTNILVDTFGNVLLADFGISLKAKNEARMITQSNTERSYDYCSPEVIAKQKRYPSSDVFSLGAVFAEMTTVVLNRPLTDFRKFRRSRDGDKSFHRNRDRVEIWMNDLAKPPDGEEEDDKHDEMIKAIPTILRMLAYKKNTDDDSGIDRPLASGLWKHFQNVSSCICHDCDPRHHSPWQHKPSSNDEQHLDHLGDLSQESLYNSSSDSHDDRRAPDSPKGEILYNAQTRMLKMVSLEELEGNPVHCLMSHSCSSR